MDALRFWQVDVPYRLSLASEPMPEPAADQVLLAARCSLISTGSELRRYRRYDGYDAFRYPVTDLGYSYVGMVVRAGDAAAASPGERLVAVQRHATHVLTRVDVDDVRTAVRVPDGVSDAEATFGPLLRSTINWLGNYAVEPDSTVVVLGQGLVGALQLQAVRLHTPRRVFATDACPLRLDLARQLGADDAIDAREDPVAAVRSLTGGRGADVVIETVGGNHTESFTQALAMCRSGGRVVVVGMHTEPVQAPPHTLHDKLIVGSQLGYDVSAARFRRAMELLGEVRFQVAPLITHHFAWEDAPQAYELLDQHPDQALGVVLDWA